MGVKEDEEKEGRRAGKEGERRWKVGERRGIKHMKLKMCNWNKYYGMSIFFTFVFTNRSAYPKILISGMQQSNA